MKLQGLLTVISIRGQNNIRWVWWWGDWGKKYDVIWYQDWKSSLSGCISWHHCKAV